METRKRAALVGVTGFIGRGLPILLKNAGYDVTGISRTGAARIPDVENWQKLSTANFANHQAIINLAGDRIDRRWTAENRRRHYESRIGVTRGIVDSIRSLSPAERPQLLVNASAVGYYGDRGDEILDESANAGNGYLAELCTEWEKAANQAKELGLRVINLRIGIVLGRDGAAFRKLLTVFKLGIGGRLGSGAQWMPWIHIDDLRAAILHAIECDSLDGPVNGCAPNPLRNSDFTRQLARALHRPAIFPVPGIALKIALGGFGGALLAGQRSMPKALISSGFEFRFPSLDSALTNLLNPTPKS